MNAKQFGNAIKAARLTQGLSRLDLAERARVRLFSIYCIEWENAADKYPVDVCQRLAKALGLEVELGVEE